MSALFARVVKQALITFERENYAAFKVNFTKLKQLADQLTSNDLNIPSEIFSFNNPPTRAPVRYIEIFEHKTFTMSVFIVSNNYMMPLHDHPGHGLLRVLSGSARIQSYSFEKPLQHTHTPHIISAIEETPLEFSTKTGCSVVTPLQNIHEISATGSSSAAFFDILSPPYESENSEFGPKKCCFYQKITFNPSTELSNSNSTKDGDDAAKSKQIVYLKQIRVPAHYYCNNIYYNPPEFLTNPSLLKSLNEEAA